MHETFLVSLQLMGQGMVGIFAVILIIYVVLLFLGKPKKKGKIVEGAEKGVKDAKGEVK